MVSKALNREASATLYSDSFFEVKFDAFFWYGEPGDDDFRLMKNTQYDRIMHLTLSGPCNTYRKFSPKTRRDLWPPFKTQSHEHPNEEKWTRVVSALVDNGPPRKTLRLQFLDCNLYSINPTQYRKGRQDQSPHSLRETVPVLQSLKTVEIELRCKDLERVAHKYDPGSDGFTPAPIHRGGPDPEWLAKYMPVVKGHLEAFLERLGKDYEPSFGPWTRHDLVAEEKEFARCLIFHPREHSALQKS